MYTSACLLAYGIRSERSCCTCAIARAPLSSCGFVLGVSVRVSVCVCLCMPLMHHAVCTSPVCGKVVVGLYCLQLFPLLASAINHCVRANTSAAHHPAIQLPHTVCSEGSTRSFTPVQHICRCASSCNTCYSAALNVCARGRIQLHQGCLCRVGSCLVPSDVVSGSGCVWCGVSAFIASIHICALPIFWCVCRCSLLPPPPLYH